jgi:hypothetical protein
MKVKVVLLNGEEIHPIYAPEHKDSVMSFYSEKKRNNEILGYVIMFDDGNVVAEGQVL